MPTIDVRIDDQYSGDTRYIYDDSGDYLYIIGPSVFYFSASSDEITGLCDMKDLPMLIKALGRIRDDNRPVQISTGLQQSTRSA